ncbi:MULTISPECIES: DNA topoisomerase IB [unclassified Aeromicrobium]|uniref:DNA topoisomerase IB n=1 Tax=unclassified Aeromicrobium TaxID=2633570 RepID=UPI002097F7BA|nr:MULTISPECIES: DNA topoisomerase IB [unclassified Aeromicrobium]MCO7240089.1 DNA topoisomerase IB [Aeromicrobium sp. CnD17-E]MDR6116841.1 DNA topoisomerase-1 [Aeromicrobium sp. SORGH_AS_0981]
MVRLRRTSPSMAGWTRVKHGRGFRYLDQDGAPLEEIDVARCKELVIPPAWTKVWICPAENGHLQAVGTDDAGRRQYLYHPAWRERRDAEKFQHMEGFATALLEARDGAREEVADDATLRSTAALAFCLLDLGIFRVGSDRYTDENGSYGLTTIEKQHVRRDGDSLVFEYVAKSGQDLEVSLRDERLVAALEPLRRRRTGGDVLLAYRGGDGWSTLGATAVNDYVKEVLGEEYSAKDFRTWRGTVIAAAALSSSDASTKTARKKSVAAAMREVAEHLGNTPAVARSSYVDPRVVDLFGDGVVVAGGHRPVAPGEPVSRTLEKQVLELLGKA